MTRLVPLDLDGEHGALTPFTALDPVAQRARFAFVGEMDHFVEEKLAVRLLCFRYLVSRGWTVFAEEWPASWGRRADEFLRTGDTSVLDPVDEQAWFTEGPLANDRQPHKELADAHRRFMTAVRRIAPRVRWYGVDADAGDAGYLAAANAATTIDELRPAMAIRERIMHANIERISRTHPGERIALFGAALHLVRDDDAVDAPGVGAGPGGGEVRSIGHHVAHDLTDDPVLSIWMLHGVGRSRNPWIPEPGTLTPAPGTFEAELSAMTSEPVFVDVTGDTAPRTITQMHNLVLRCRLADQVDAIVFVPEVTPLGSATEPPAGPAPGPLLASGRAADVYDLGDGTVLRRYRSDHDAEPEGRLMAWLASAGIRVPRIHSASGRDLVMERIDGPTMLEDLRRRPWTLRRHVRTLAELQHSINQLRAPDWCPIAPGVPGGDRVVHGDLHPMNVILGEDGPVVIDFSNSGRGPAAFDAALSYVLMSTFETSGQVDRIAQLAIVRTFRRARGSALVEAGLADACRFRLADSNITPGERARVAGLT